MCQKFIYYLRTYPVSLVTALGIWFLCLIKPPQSELMDFQNSDKVAHAVAYLIFGAVIWCEYLYHHKQISRKRLLVGAVLMPVLMSGVIEWTQANLTTNRSGEWADFAANSLGIVMAAACAMLYVRLRRRKH